jgi:Helix-turn-helix domain
MSLTIHSSASLSTGLKVPEGEGGLARRHPAGLAMTCMRSRISSHPTGRRRRTCSEGKASARPATPTRWRKVIPMRETVGQQTLLTIKDVAERTRIPLEMIRWLRQQGRFAPAIKVGRRLVWDVADLDAWLIAERRRMA